MGLVIDSWAFAQRLVAAFDRNIPRLAYELRPASTGGCIEWIDRTPAGEIRHAVELRAGPWDRAMIRSPSVLPIDWVL